MTSNLEPAAPTAATAAPVHPRAAELLNTSALPATTALLAASEPKFPRAVGD